MTDLIFHNVFHDLFHSLWHILKSGVDQINKTSSWIYLNKRHFTLRSCVLSKYQPVDNPKSHLSAKLSMQLFTFISFFKE